MHLQKSHKNKEFISINSDNRQTFDGLYDIAVSAPNLLLLSVSIPTKKGERIFSSSLNIQVYEIFISSDTDP